MAVVGKSTPTRDATEVQVKHEFVESRPRWRVPSLEI